MISRKQIFFWLCGVIVLALLYMASSTDLIFRDEEPEIYRVSVIIDDSTDDAYANFRKGVEQAALDYQIDVNFISLYNAADAEEQQELIRREIEDDADGLVLIPVDSELYTRGTAAGQISVPVLYLEDDIVVDSHAASGVYRFHYEEIGADLAQRAKEHCAKQPKLLLVSGRQIYGRREQIVRGAQTVLGEDSVSILLTEESADSESALMKQLKGQSDIVLAALDNEGMELILGMTRELEEQGVTPRAIYSTVSTVRTLSSLRKGSINGVYFTDDYTAGYQSIKILKERLENILTGMEDVDGHYYFVDKQALDSGEYDRLLYPMG